MIEVTTSYMVNVPLLLVCIALFIIIVISGVFSLLYIESKIREIDKKINNLK